MSRRRTTSSARRPRSAASIPGWNSRPRCSATRPGACSGVSPSRWPLRASRWHWPSRGPGLWERSARWLSSPTIRLRFRCRSGRRCRRPACRRPCRSPSSCWSSRCRCRSRPTSGAPVLEADVEVDRREFAVRAALSVAPGERLALFGPSGAGKTTLLEAIAGLVPPRRGRIALGGRMLTSTESPACFVPPWQRRVGLLRQDPGLFPHLSVRDNLCYAPGTDPSGAELEQVAGVLGISGLLSAMPARLSGGQAHRVALGRLLLAHREALLLDEPYSGLDASLRRVLTELVVELVSARSVPAMLGADGTAIDPPGRASAPPHRPANPERART